MGNLILGAATKSNVGKSDGRAGAGQNTNIADAGLVTTNNGATKQGPQNNTHTGQKANAANVGQDALNQGQTESNIQASNAAKQQAQQIAKSLNSNDKVHVNVTVEFR